MNIRRHPVTKAPGPVCPGKGGVVIAFPGGRGTADMVSRAKAAEITVIEPKGTQGDRG